MTLGFCTKNEIEKVVSVRKRDCESKQKIMVVTAGFKNHNNVCFKKLESPTSSFFLFSFIGFLADEKIRK